MSKRETIPSVETSNQLRHDQLAELLFALTNELENLNELFQESNEQLRFLAKKEMERELQCEIKRIYDPATDTFELHAYQSLVSKLGVVNFIKKVLWSENLEELAWISVFDRLTPSLERIAERYAVLLLNDAVELLNEIKQK